MTKEDSQVNCGSIINCENDMRGDDSYKCSECSLDYSMLSEASHQNDSSDDSGIKSDVVVDQVASFIRGIISGICDNINYGEEDENEEEVAKEVHVHSTKEIKDYYRKTFVFDDSDLNEKFTDVEEEEEYEGNQDVGIGTSRESLQEDFGENLDQNRNTTKENSAINNLTVNKYELRNISKSSEAISPLISEVPKRAKKFSLSNIFRNKKDKEPKKVTKSKTEMEHESYDSFNFDNFNSQPPRSLLNSKKYSSEMNLSRTASVSRTPSFRKKLVTETKSLIRSLSVRDLSRKKEKGKLSEMKKIEWKSSLQRLVETDTGVSYDDLSFVNYDQLNTLSYTSSTPKKKETNVHRTQSMVEKRSPGCQRTNLTRGTSVNDRCSLQLTLAEQSGALSLPALHHLNQENVDQPDVHPSHRYRRRQQSISSEDGKSRPCGNGSFRSAGSGCAKLKRHNACRQKNRDVNSLNFEGRAAIQDDQTVRSRSLNHLDTLEMRQGVVPSTNPALKDSRSEPDCTRPLLVPPAVPEPHSPAPETHPNKRHMLSRSQKSSSECFSVAFEVGDEPTCEPDLLFPAVRGVSLHESLAKLCELRNIELSSCDVWLTDKDSNTNAWLSLTQDTASLVGKHVRITAKDPSNKKLSGSIIHGNHTRKLSAGSKQRTGSFFSSSTEDPAVSSSPNLSLHEFDTAKKQSKQPRWSAFFSNNKDTRMEHLIEQLNGYSKHGIPKTQDMPDYPQGQCPSIDALYKLEDDWRDIIDDSEIPERLQQQQTALWELIKTEVAYIKTLKVVTDLFLACLKNLQSVNILKEIDTEKLFSNITDILAANVCFWRNSLFPLVRDMRKYKQPPCIENMCEGFSKMRETFQAYFRYCAEQSRCSHYCRDILAHNELFTAYLAWCETQKECNRLKLMDILVQPMQRLTKYGLLLKAILKNTDDDVERESLTSMIKMVDDFVNSVNHSLKQKQDNERLKGIIARIESYDIVESKDDDLEKLLKSYSQLDLNRPMLGCPPERRRHLLLEGDLKLKDSNTSKMEVHCFLLTDMLLICKPSTKKGGATMRVIRQPYLVDRLVVTELTRETPSLAVIYKNEFDMATAAFILQNTDAKKLKSWKDGIAKAQSLYAQAKQMSYMTEESLDTDYSFDYNMEGEFHSLHLAPRSPLASSSRASRVSSLAHSHSGSVEMNDQSSIGSNKDQSRAVSVENENRTASISSDEGVQPIPPDKSPVSQKSSFKYRIFNKTPNTLSVQPLGNLGQSLPNLVTLGSPNVGTLSLSFNQNTLSVPNTKNGGHLLSPTSRGISYPPPSPTRGNLRRGLAISQSKNPPLIKTRHVNSTSTVGTSGQVPASFDFDVPVIAAISPSGENCDSFSRGQHRQAMIKRVHRNDNKRYHTAGAVDDLKRDDVRDASIHKRLSWNCTSQDPQVPDVDRT